MPNERETTAGKYLLSIEHAQVRHAACDAFDVNFICESKQVKRSSHEWINKFIIANLTLVIISIICSSDE